MDVFGKIGWTDYPSHQAFDLFVNGENKNYLMVLIDNVNFLRIKNPEALKAKYGSPHRIASENAFYYPCISLPFSCKWLALRAPDTNDCPFAFALSKRSMAI